jgi:hypothetical protein
MGANAKVLPLVQGSQDGTAPPNSLELLGRANVCYRFFLAAPSSRVGVALTLRDSVGDIALDAVAPGPNLVAPPRGYLCFERDDRAAMVVSLGQGGPHAFALLVEESPRTPR